ncbi:3'(2'),5'-bisphosphate nucleotidase CysQ [Rhodococcus globerulus]|uniref:3'(2'),5'-bisphosphate nucleotidase CysQ n=1 Tax=Rhodococcus globerulus TaxID=33008 RepID=UPI003AFB7FD4
MTRTTTHHDDPPEMICDTSAAIDIATAAGELLLRYREALNSADVDPVEFRKGADRSSQEFIARELSNRFRGDAVLSEEAPDSTERLGASRVWIIDPLDGTREFGEAGRSDWAVHVALIENGSLTAGAVALPGLGITHSSKDPIPQFGVVPSSPRVVVSRTRRPEPVMALAHALDAELIEMGSAGAKAMAVVRGDADIYAHAGGQYEWDSAAPVAVAQAAGLHVSRIDGSALHYNQENPWLPDLLICRAEIAATTLEVLNR